MTGARIFTHYGHTLTLLELDSHRNGISGERFYVARIHWRAKDGQDCGEMLVTHFPNYDDEGERTTGGPMRTAVLSLDILRRPEGATVEFGVNSWRPELMHDAVIEFTRRGLETYKLTCAERGEPGGAR